MMQIKIGLDNASWCEELARLPSEYQDVYYRPEIYNLHVVEGQGDAYCTSIVEGDARLFIPGLRMAIPNRLPARYGGPYWDVQGCNGPGSILASPEADPDFLERAWSEWRRVNAAQGIVAAFFRMHPVLDGRQWLSADAKVRTYRKTVFVDLADGMEAAWKRAESVHRNRVNKGRREGVQVRWDDPCGWEDFERLYGEAMERLNAWDPARYSHKHFRALRDVPYAELACVRNGDKLEAGAVFLYGSRWAHYHHGARDADAPSYVMNCVFQAGLERAAERGLDGLHFGGGQTTALDDPLLRFKRRSGGRLVDYNIALVIANPEVYEALCQAWIEEAGEAPQWLMAYRQPIGWTESDWSGSQQREEK